MKFCRDCKHSEGPITQLKCNSPKNGVDYVDEARYAVTGEVQPTVRAALSAECTPLRRQLVHPSLGIPLCGPDGLWWEAK